MIYDLASVRSYVRVRISCGPHLQLGAVLLVKSPAGLGGPQILLDRVHAFEPRRRHAERDAVVLERLSLVQRARGQIKKRVMPLLHPQNIAD